MLIVQEDNTVKLTRGDTAYLEVPLVLEDSGDPYEVKQDDTLTLGLKKTINDSTCCLRKEVGGSSIFKLVPEDTAALEFGTYKYDVELRTVDGDVFTVINNASFIVLPEVV